MSVESGRLLFEEAAVSQIVMVAVGDKNSVPIFRDKTVFCRIGNHTI